MDFGSERTLQRRLHPSEVLLGLGFVFFFKVLMAFCCLLIPAAGIHWKIQDWINVQVARVLTRSVSPLAPGGKGRSGVVLCGPREPPMWD